jgi:hypothetical protein
MYVPAAKVSEVVRKPKYRSGVGTSANCVTSTKLWSRLGIAFAVAAGKVRPVEASAVRHDQFVEVVLSRYRIRVASNTGRIKIPVFNRAAIQLT